MGTIWGGVLFRGLLRAGEWSDIFQSQSAILTNQEHHIQFFCLNVGAEIARIEAPQWVMAGPAEIDLVHSAVFDQCRRSSQYPPHPPGSRRCITLSTSARASRSELSPAD